MTYSSQRMVTGVVAADNSDPANTARFEPTWLRFTFAGRSGALDDFRAPDGLVMGLIAGRREVSEIHGNAVLVAPGVALCATHVVQPYFQDIPSGQVSLMGFAVAAHGVNLWRVKHLTTSRFCDITFLAVEPASAIPPSATYRQAALTTRFPAIGERLLCLGFRPDREAYPSGSDTTPGQPRAHHFNGQVIATAGTVLQQFPEGRDTRLLPWPALEVDFPAWGGMSGGPVFDASGLLVGVLCRSWTTDGEPSPSYVSHIYPAVQESFRREWPTLAGVADFATLSQFDDKLCAIAGRDAVTPVPEGRVGYRFWS